MSTRFSDRHGYRLAPPEITVYEDAPSELRDAIPLIAQVLGMQPSKMREAICQVLLVRPDPYNWSEYPNIWEEVGGLMTDAEWYKVYDIAEALYSKMAEILPFSRLIMPNNSNGASMTFLWRTGSAGRCETGRSICEVPPHSKKAHMRFPNSLMTQASRAPAASCRKHCGTFHDDQTRTLPVPCNMQWRHLSQLPAKSPGSQNQHWANSSQS